MMMEPLDPITSCIYEIQYPSLDLSKHLDKKETETLDSTVKYPEAVETEESSRSGSFKWRIHEKQTRKNDWEVESRLGEFKRICVDCQTTKTPLWRGGPAGPKSLCNACGIRYRKKRRAALGLKPEEKEKQGRRMKVGSPLKVQLLALEDDIYMQKSFSNVPILQKKRTMVKEEEEEAAALLMALSCGLIHA